MIKYIHFLSLVLVIFTPVVSVAFLPSLLCLSHFQHCSIGLVHQKSYGLLFASTDFRFRTQIPFSRIPDLSSLEPPVKSANITTNNRQFYRHKVAFRVGPIPCPYRTLWLRPLCIGLAHRINVIVLILHCTPSWPREPMASCTQTMIF